MTAMPDIPTGQPERGAVAPPVGDPLVVTGRTLIRTTRIPRPVGRAECHDSRVRAGRRGFEGKGAGA